MRESLAATGKDVANVEKGLSRGLRKAFDDLVFDGASLADALDGLATSMMNTTFNAAMRPVTDQVGGLLASGVGGLMQGLLPFADGAPFSQGRGDALCLWWDRQFGHSVRDAWRHGRHG